MPRYIDEQELYRATDGGRNIFAHYFPGYDFGNYKAFVKERPDEKTASARIVFYNGLWRITDFGNQAEVNSLPGVQYVMYKENLQYYEALLFVEQVIVKREVSARGYVRPRWTAEYDCREMTDNDEVGRYDFHYKEVPSAEDLAAIGPFVKPEHLKRFDGHAVDYYEYCAYSKKKGKNVVHIFKSTPDYPIFVFDYGSFKKLYRPHEMDKKLRFSYVGDKPADYVYGLKQLKGVENEFADPETGEEVSLPAGKPLAKVKELVRCSGESDALNLYSIGCHVYWLNSESASYGGRFSEIDDLCRDHYQILDLDATGRKMAAKIALDHIGLKTMELPEWLATKKDFRGNPCKDIKDFIAQFKTDTEAAHQVAILKAKARSVKFWSKNPEKGTINLSMELFLYFLKMTGFYITHYPYMPGEDYCYIRLQGQEVNFIKPKELKWYIKNFTKEWIKSKNLKDEIAILDKIHTSSYFSESTLDGLNENKVDFDLCKADEEYLHFKNCSLRIRPESIDRIKRAEVPGYVFGPAQIKTKTLTQILPRNLTRDMPVPPISIDPTDEYAALQKALKQAKDQQEQVAITRQINAIAQKDRYVVKVNDDKFIFSEFLRDLANIYWEKKAAGEALTEDEKKNENLALANIMFALGYLTAQYKDPAKPWLVFAQDMKVSEVGKASGRSGKSLLAMALKHVRNVASYQFIYDGLSELHDIVNVDDMHEMADFGFFYTQITGERLVNAKHTSPVELVYEKSGKMLITSNYELPNTDSSTISRLLSVGVSDYYHEKSDYNEYKESWNPRLKYGRALFYDFTEEEWTKFYLFMAYCVQLQMRFFKIEPPMDNLQKRQYRREMSSGLGRGENFLSWADDYFMEWAGDKFKRPEYSGATISDGMQEDQNVYLNTYFLKRDAIRDFLDNSGIPDNKRRSFNSQSFKKKLQAWCKYHGYELNPEDTITDVKGKRIIKKWNSRAEEFMYIRTPDDESTAPTPAVEPTADDVQPVSEDKGDCPF